MPEPFIQHQQVVSFAETKVNLLRDDVAKYREQVNHLREDLSTYINQHPDFNLVKMYHSGSVMKGTALKTINDMDVAVYIRPGEETADERRLLYWLIDRLREVYPTMRPEQFTLQEHCVTVSFAGSGLNVDVAPVIYEGDPKDRGYLIVKDTGERVLTSIPMHLEFIRSRKKSNPDHFAQIVRLVKWWVRQRKAEDPSFRFKSFMVELICAHLADNGLILSDYPAALEKVFAYLVTSGLKKRIAFGDNYDPTAIPQRAQSAIEIYDPVNSSNNVASKYTEYDRTRMIEAAHGALDALTEARFATTKERALSMWQEVFGASFR